MEGACWIMHLVNDRERLAKKIISSLSIILSVIALVLAILVYASTLDYEPLIPSIGIAAAILTVFIDPWLDRRTQRQDLLKSILFESYINTRVLQSEKFNKLPAPSEEASTFPRLVYGSIDRALSSGLFNDDTDGKLRSALIDS